MQEIPDSLAKALEVMFEQDFCEWDEIQRSVSMDFPVVFDRMMHQIEEWKVGTVGMCCHGTCQDLTEGICFPNNKIVCTTCGHEDEIEEEELNGNRNKNIR